MFQAKTKKGKGLVKTLEVGGFQVQWMCAEQFGTKRFAFFSVSPKDLTESERMTMRGKAEAFLEKSGYKVDKKYFPGSAEISVLLGNYSADKDGHVAV